GRFGCSECYNEFDFRLDQLLRRIHGSARHTGKIPERKGKTILIKKKIKELRNELERAVAKEEFERAAELRDRIRELERRSMFQDGGEG
ncbi:UvrB/UvrC motif-containing protein, partial [Limnohabitans sp. Rim47]